MAPSTVGAIALHSTGNIQGGYFFFRLSSSRRINRKKWTVLPMPDNAIQIIHQLACHEPLEQMENAGKDDDSTNVPNEEGSEKDDDSIHSIDSL
eukprot:13111208-Ditylum_brightwellii.AAC.1